jgi:hypothetical protein
VLLLVLLLALLLAPALVLLPPLSLLPPPQAASAAASTAAASIFEGVWIMISSVHHGSLPSSLSRIGYGCRAAPTDSVVAA